MKETKKALEGPGLQQTVQHDTLEANRFLVALTERAENHSSEILRKWSKER